MFNHGQPCSSMVKHGQLFLATSNMVNHGKPWFSIEEYGKPWLNTFFNGQLRINIVNYDQSHLCYFNIFN